MFNIEHFLLFTILFGLSFVLAMKSQKSYERNFWGTAAFFIIAYTIIVGLRYGWGIDYFRYEYSYNTINTNSLRDYDLAYWKLFEIEKSLGLSFAGSLVFSSLLTIVSYFSIVKAMKGNKYMLMCFLPATLLYTTYALRQFQAITYINIAIALLLFDDNILKNKKISIAVSILLIFLAYHTHAGTLIYAIVFLVYMFFRWLKPLTYKVTITAYLIAIVFSNIITQFFSDVILSYIHLFELSEHFQGYINNIDSRVLGSDSMDQKTFGHGGIYQIFHYIGYACILYIMGKALEIKPNKKVTIIYNVVVIAILLQQLFFIQEIMRRIIDPFAILYFIPLGYALNVFWEYRKQPFKGYIFYGCCVIMSLLLIYYPMLNFLTSFELAGFVWN